MFKDMTEAECVVFLDWLATLPAAGQWCLLV